MVLTRTMLLVISKYREEIAAALAADLTARSAPAPETFEAANTDSVSLQPGMPVAAFNGGAARGYASSASRAHVVGFATTSTAVTLPASVQSSGKLVLPTAQWDAVSGQSGGLTPGETYYLGAVPGTITTTPPSTPGLSLTVLGTALSPTALHVSISSPIYL